MGGNPFQESINELLNQAKQLEKFANASGLTAEQREKAKRRAEEIREKIREKIRNLNTGKS